MAVNLPSYSSELVGREHEVAELVEMICERGARLVTLIGPGGTGKTRLAVTVAGDPADRVPGRGVLRTSAHGRPGGPDLGRHRRGGGRADR